MPSCDRCHQVLPVQVRPLGEWVPARILRQFGIAALAGEPVALCDRDRRELLQLLRAYQSFQAPGSSPFDLLLSFQMLFEGGPVLQQLRGFLQDVVDSVSARHRPSSGEAEEPAAPGEADTPGEAGEAGAPGAAGFPGAFFGFFPGGEVAPVGRRGARTSQGIDDLTELARRGRLDPVVGREDEMRKLEDILTRRTKNNAVLIGEAGVGKTAIAEGLAQRVVSGTVSAALRGRKILRLDLGAMLAGTRYRGDFEERFKRAMDEAARTHAIVFIDELHTVLGAGAAEGTLDAGNMLKPLLTRGELQVIGATTADEYHRTIENDPALDRRFSPVWVSEPSHEETVEILKALRTREIEYYRNLPEVRIEVQIPDEVLEEAVRLARQYVPQRHLPDKAVDLVQDAVAHRVVELSGHLPAKGRDGDKNAASGAQPAPGAVGEMERLQREIDQAVREQAFERAAELKRRRDALREAATVTISLDDVADAVSRRTGIPVGRLSASESERLGRLEDVLGQRVFGQDEAVHALARAVRVARVGLGKEHGAYAFFFLGPTGVGKTELAKALAEALFGTDEALVSFDMSEYQEAHTLSRLLGSPPGYVGYGEEGRLIKALKEHPYSVLLFDEVEKAHPDIWGAFLQLMAEGRVTGANGHTADASHAYLIFTSNVGSRELAREAIGFHHGDEGHRDREERAREALRRSFRPEFLGRLDAVVVFKDLGRREYHQIAAKFARRLSDIVAERWPGVRLDWSPAALDWLTEAGGSPETGAREMERLVQREVAEQLVDLGRWREDGSVGQEATLTVDVPAPAEQPSIRHRLVLRTADGRLLAADEPVAAPNSPGV